MIGWPAAPMESSSPVTIRVASAAVTWELVLVSVILSVALRYRLLALTFTVSRSMSVASVRNTFPLAVVIVRLSTERFRALVALSPTPDVF